MAAFALLASAILLAIRKYAMRHFTAYFQMNAEFYGFLGEQLAGTEDMRANGATGYVMWRFYRSLRRRLPPSRNAVMSIYGMVVTTIVVFAIGNSIALVTQDVQLLHATVRDNLTFFNATIADERIVEVLVDLGLSTWYRSLPRGLDTELGSDGQGLSAGEAQLPKLN